MWKKVGGDIFDRFGKTRNMVIVSTSGSVKSGNLIMRSGAAKGLKMRSPNSASLCAHYVYFVMANGRDKYGFIPVTPDFGIFQVQYNYKDKADISLISYSALLLGDFAEKYPEVRFHLEWPYQVAKSDIKVIENIFDTCFKDNIYVWRPKRDK